MDKEKPGELQRDVVVLSNELLLQKERIQALEVRCDEQSLLIARLQEDRTELYGKIRNLEKESKGVHHVLQEFETSRNEKMEGPMLSWSDVIRLVEAMEGRGSLPRQ